MKKLFVLAAIASSLAIGMMSPGAAVASGSSDDDDGGPIVSNPPTSGPASPPPVRDPFYSGAAGGQITTLNGVYDNHVFNNTTGGSTGGSAHLGGSAASGYISATNTQSVQASASANSGGAAPGEADGGGNGYVIYYMTVYGPDATTVPIIANGYLSTSASTNTGAADAQAIFSVYSPDGITGGHDYTEAPRSNTGQAELDCSGEYGGDGCGRLDYAIDFNLATGSQAVLYLSAEAGAGAGDYYSAIAGVAQAQAIADPLFSIDPIWAAAHPGYQLAFSSGIANGVSAAPEPGTWALSILGLVFVGGALRYRRRQRQAFA